LKLAARPLAGEPQNQAGSFSPPAAAKFVRTIFKIVHICAKTFGNIRKKYLLIIISLGKKLKVKPKNNIIKI